MKHKSHEVVNKGLLDPTILGKKFYFSSWRFYVSEKSRYKEFSLSQNFPKSIYLKFSFFHDAY